MNLRSARASAHNGQELAITPPRGLRRGSAFVVGIDYAGQPEPVVDPDDAIEGWVPTEDGAFVVGEPQGTPGWIPVNDSLRDRATFDFAITVPKGSTAIANGVLLSRRDRGDSTTWRWLAPAPMVPYLATATNGIFQTRFERLNGGLRRFDAVDPQTRSNDDDPPNPALAFERLDPEPEIVDFFTEALRPVPVRERRRDRRLGARRRLRARVPDARELRPHPGRVDRRARDRAPVVRRLRSASPSGRTCG